MDYAHKSYYSYKYVEQPFFRLIDDITIIDVS